MDDMGRRLTWARERKGMSKSALAEATGIGRRTIIRIERGITDARPEMADRRKKEPGAHPATLRALALALDIDPVWLETGTLEIGPGQRVPWTPEELAPDESG